MYNMLRENTTIADRIQKINDESRDNLVDIIVQVEGGTTGNPGLKKTTTEFLSRKRMALTPRDIINTKAQGIDLKRSRKKIKTKKSHSSELATLKKRKSAGLVKSMKSSFIKQSMARMESAYKQHMPTTSLVFKPPTFWTSQSMLLKLTKDELQSLPTEVTNIRDVRVNRQLSIPVIKTNKALAIESEDRLSTTWGLARSNAFGAWGVYGAEGQGVTIAVLDTGIDPNHKDLAGKISHWAEFDRMGNIIDTQNPRDSDRHGTHVAGTIVGGNESGRWIGMAPQAEIAAGLVLDGDIGGTDAQVLAGMQWAIEKGVDVINMSLGGLAMDAETPPTYSEAIISAMLAGIPVVCAIGNDGEQTTGLPGSDLFALSVGASDPTDRAAGFSGGRTQIIFESEFLDSSILPLPYIKPDLSAPGVAVYSSTPENGYDAFSGTSMATPHVSGAIALLLSATNIRESLESQDRFLTIQNFITGSVDDIGENGQDSRYGFGRIDVLRAIDFAVKQGFGIDG